MNTLPLSHKALYSSYKLLEFICNQFWVAFFILFSLLALLITFRLSNGAYLYDLPNTFLISILLVAIVFSTSRSLLWFNFSITHRKEKYISFLEHAEHSLIIYTGEFYHGIYDNDFVVMLEKLLEKDVDICFYVESTDIDIKSIELKKFIEKYNVPIVKNVQSEYSHFASIDGKSSRVELFPSACTNQGDKHAIYMWHRPLFTQSIQKRLLG